MIDVGSRCRPYDKGLRRIFHKLCDFLDDLEYRVPFLYKINSMIEFIYYKNKDNRGLVGVEIGVFRGINAYSILSFLPIKKLYLIDSYLEYDNYKEDWIPNHSQRDFNDDYMEARKRLLKYKNKIQFIRATSSEAITQIPDNLDFCYIDGNHAYEYVKQDIELYYPKICMGGIIGGDNFETEFQGVPKAVLEFVGQNNLKLRGANKDWWIIKGEKQ